MLGFDFDHYLPDTIKEAVDIYDSVKKEGKAPYYYGGGTEILSMSRVWSIKPDAIIDIKKIPECLRIGTDGTTIFIGAAVTLNDIAECDVYPLLGLAAGRIADHTVQCRLTLGGNLAGTVMYHEALLPLLLADSVIDIAGPYGTRKALITEVLNFKKNLNPEELIIRVCFDKKYASLPYVHVKKSKTEKIGYPLVSLCAICQDGIMRAAASGLCDYPFRFEDINIGSGQTPGELAQQLAQKIPGPVLDDIGGCAAYRLFIFEKTVENTIIRFRKSPEGVC